MIETVYGYQSTYRQEERIACILGQQVGER